MTDTPVQPKYDLTREYVAAGRSFTGLRRLEWAFDDLTWEMGDDVYQRMLNDAVVNANITVLKTAILEDGANLTSAVSDKLADGYDQAAALVDEAERALSDLTFPLDAALWSLLDALALGCKVAEEVYAIDKAGSKRQYVLQALKPKPRTSVAFVVDPYLNVRGLIGLNAVNGMRMPGLLGDADAKNLLPREKFAVFSFRPKDADIRGTSILRAAYNFWHLKCQTLPEYYKYLVQFASPSLLGVASEHDDPDATDPESGAPITAVQALLNALLDFRNGSVIAVPYGAQVKELASQGEGKAFLEALSLYDRQITTAMLTQTRATQEAQHGSKADSETASDILGTMVRQMRTQLARVLREDVLRDLVRYNHGDQFAALTPKVSFGETEQHEVAPLMTAVAALERVNYLDPSQYPALDVQLGLAARTPEEVQQRSERAKNPPPAPQPGKNPGQQAGTDITDNPDGTEESQQ